MDNLYGYGKHYTTIEFILHQMQLNFIGTHIAPCDVVSSFNRQRKEESVAALLNFDDRMQGGSEPLHI
jgi:hypothetical protein